MEKHSKIFVAGHRGLVGSAILRNLQNKGYTSILVRTRQELDLTESVAVANFFATERPQYVFLAAAKVGGIHANSRFGGDFIRENIQIQTNIIVNSHRFDVEKLLFLGSNCLYPKVTPQPIKERSFLDGKIEETNKPYAIAKIAGIMMCQAYNQQYGTNYISAMPANVYGPNDNFDLESSHVLPALIRKIHEAKTADSTSAIVWGTGTPRREFLHVDDLADACLFLMYQYNETEIINVGTGEDISIRELAEIVCDTVSYAGDLIFDTSKPDGAPKRLLDISRLQELGWKARIDLSSGIRNTYKWFVETGE